MKENWTYKKLGEVAEITMGQSPEGSSVNNEKGVEFHQGKIFFGEKYLSVSHQYTNAPTKLAKAHALLLCVRAPVGVINITERPICIGRGLCAIVPKDNLENGFAYYSLQSKRSYFEKNSTGSTFKAISSSIVKNTTIPVPPLSEQYSIVQELDTINEVLSKKREQLKELDKLAQSIFYDMFGDPVTNEKGWEKVQLADVCDVRDGTHDSPQYLQSSKYVLITSKNIKDDTIDFATSVNYISEDDYIAINKRSKVDIGDILMPMIGTIGNPIIVAPTDQQYCVKNVALIKFAELTKVINVYIKRLLDNPSYMSYLIGLNKGGTQKFVALGTIRKLSIPLPPLPLQQAFAAKIEKIEQMKDNLRASIKETETLLASRMSYWFE